MLNQAIGTFGEISQPEMPSRELIQSIMLQVTTTQEIRRSHTSPTQVNTPIPVDTPTNPFSPTHMEPSSLQIGTEFHAQTMAEDVPPTFYPGATSSQPRLPSHYLPRDKGKGKETSPHTLPRQPIFPDQPGGDDDDEPGDDDDNGNPPPGPPGPLPPPPPPGPFGPGIAAPAPIVPIPNGKERGNKPEPFTDVKKFKMFHLAYIIYFMQNNNVYPTDQDKILFILSLMNDGVRGEWMKHWMAQLLAGRQCMPSYDEFNEQLEKRFLDPNLDQLEYQSITKMTWEQSKKTLPKFFTRFEIAAGHAGYLRIDKELIYFLEQKIP